MPTQLRMSHKRLQGPDSEYVGYGVPVGEINYDSNQQLGEFGLFEELPFLLSAWKQESRTRVSKSRAATLSKNPSPISVHPPNELKWQHNMLAGRMRA